jgi:hypothetical protein
MNHPTHQQRIETLQARSLRIDSRGAAARHTEARFPWLRLFSLLIWITGTYLALSLTPPPAAWALSFILLAVFVMITIAHRRVLAAIERYDALAWLTNSRIARANIDWGHIPAHFSIEVSPDHPFDRDLIVTGPRSLHHLIDSTTSTGGSRRLANWLLETKPNIAAIETRQQQVRELVNLPGLRARLALNGALIAFQDRAGSGDPTHTRRWDGDAVLRWLHHNTSSASLRRYLVVLGFLAALNLTLFALNAAGILPAWWILTLVIYLGVQSYKFQETSEVFGEAYGLARRLEQLKVILSDLESYPFQPASELARLCTPFQMAPALPSRILRRASLIASAASVRGNPFLSLALNLLVPWDMFFAYQLDQFKQRLSSVLPAWLEALYTLEALGALAEFSVLNPGYSNPVLHPPASDPILRTTAIGHPLIPYSARVANPFTINQMGTIILVTGSNMSGKSTFLRTVGANLCLAYAGSVVCADQLHVQPFRLFASMNVADSLNDGISFFYAEVRRLKALLDALLTGEPGDEQSLPLFFLIDEIFRGTNNRERRVGSESYLRALAGKHGTGLISTHDLELVLLEKEIPQMQNYHFREDIEGERMVFDYRLLPGPSPTTNALRIMALAGLPVQPTGN